MPHYTHVSRYALRAITLRRHATRRRHAMMFAITDAAAAMFAVYACYAADMMSLLRMLRYAMLRAYFTLRR